MAKTNSRFARRSKASRNISTRNKMGAIKVNWLLNGLQQNIPKNLQKVEGKIDAVLSYVDLSNIEIPYEFAAGQKHAKISQPCHGTAFLQAHLSMV